MLFKEPKVAANVISAVQGLVLIKGFNVFDKAVIFADIPAMVLDQDAKIAQILKEKDVTGDRVYDSRSFAHELSRPDISAGPEITLNSGIMLVGNRLYRKGDIVHPEGGVEVNAIDAVCRVNITGNYKSPVETLIGDLSGNDNFFGKALFGDNCEDVINLLSDKAKETLAIFEMQTLSVMPSVDVSTLDDSLPTINVFDVNGYAEMLAELKHRHNPAFYGYTLELDTPKLKLAPFATMLIETVLSLFGDDTDEGTEEVRKRLFETFVAKPENVQAADYVHYLTIDETTNLAP